MPPRCDGRPRRDLRTCRPSAARLRGHVRQGLPYPFPATRALCAVSPCVLSSSSPLRSISSCFTQFNALKHICQRTSCTKKGWTKRAASSTLTDLAPFRVPWGGQPLGAGRFLPAEAFFLVIGSVRLSVRTAKKVPMVWKIDRKSTRLNSSHR